MVWYLNMGTTSFYLMAVSSKYTEVRPGPWHDTEYNNANYCPKIPFNIVLRDMSLVFHVTTFLAVSPLKFHMHYHHHPKYMSSSS